MSYKDVYSPLKPDEYEVIEGNSDLEGVAHEKKKMDHKGLLSG